MLVDIVTNYIYSFGDRVVRKQWVYIEGRNDTTGTDSVQYGYEVIGRIDLIFGWEVRGDDMLGCLAVWQVGVVTWEMMGLRGLFALWVFTVPYSYPGLKFAHNWCEGLRWLIFVDCSAKFVYLDFQCGSGVAGDRLEFRTAVCIQCGQ